MLQDNNSPRSQQEPSLSVQHISKVFTSKTHPDRTVKAVSDVSFDVYPGEVVVLLGANGAGKSTTLSCAQGLATPSSGAIKLLGKNPAQATPELKARVGVMLQDGGLPQSIKPIAFLKHLASMYAEPADVDVLVRRLKIDTFNNSSIRRLSGGQKQRVSLAAALLGKPEILFLDEPSAGLDPQSRQVVFDIIKEQKALGTAIVLTTHLLDDAEKLADYVYIIDKGRNATEGTVHDLANKNVSAKKLTVAFVNQLSETLELPSWTQEFSLVQAEFGFELSGDLSTQHVQRVIEFASSQSLALQDLHYSTATLEDVYLEISGKEIR